MLKALPETQDEQRSRKGSCGHMHKSYMGPSNTITGFNACGVFADFLEAWHP